MLKVEFGLTRTGTTSIYQVDFNDVSEFVRNVSVSRGKSNELDSYDAGSANVQLSNENRMFDPNYAASPYASAIAPTGVVRISKDNNQIFIGLITDWNFTYDQSGDAIAEIQATDAFWLLSNLTINERTPQDGQTSTQRIQTVLQYPEVNWSLSDTDLSIGAAVLGGDASPYIIGQGSGVLEYLQSIEKSEVGRLFIGKDGKLVFKSRLDDIFALNYSYSRTNLSTNPSFENDVVGWGGLLSLNSAYYYVGSKCASINANETVGQYFNGQSNGTYTCSFWARASADTYITLTGRQSYNGTTYETVSTKDEFIPASSVIVNNVFNPVFKTNTSGYTNLTRVVAPNNQSYSGWVGQMNTTSFAVNNGGYLYISGAGLSGYQTTVNVVARVVATAPVGATMRAIITWYTLSGSPIGSVNGASFTLSSDGTYVSGTFVNPIYYDTTYGQNASAVYYTVTFAIVTGTVSTAYVLGTATSHGANAAIFDPDLGRAEGFNSGWYGSPLASASFYQQWKRCSITFTLGADYLNGHLMIQNKSLSNTLEIDAVLIEASPTLDSYFDGSIGEADKVVDGVTYTYTESWNI